MLESVTCNNCQTNDAEVLFSAGIAQINQIVRCKSCGLMYANPRPDQPAHVALALRADEVVREEERLYTLRIEKETIQVRDYDDTRHSLNKLYPNRGALIEIGSGSGFLLAAFKKEGWQVLGIEPDAVACEYARSTNHVDARACILETANLPEQSADVVIMNHVIEHVPDPRATLRAIYRVLKPGGHLVIETPRYDTLMFRLLGRRERSLSCDGHIYFFTEASLRNCYEGAGFRRVDFRPVGRTLTLNRLALNLGIMTKNRRIKQWLENASRVFGLNKIRLYLNTGDMQRVCLVK
jgi:SAM-dependent methyltransferase